jgi:hypothetical protein
MLNGGVANKLTREEYTIESRYINNSKIKYNREGRYIGLRETYQNTQIQYVAQCIFCDSVHIDQRRLSTPPLTGENCYYY